MMQKIILLTLLLLLGYSVHTWATPQRTITLFDDLVESSDKKLERLNVKQFDYSSANVEEIKQYISQTSKTINEIKQTQSLYINSFERILTKIDEYKQEDSSAELSEFAEQVSQHLAYFISVTNIQLENANEVLATLQQTLYELTSLEPAVTAMQKENQTLADSLKMLHTELVYLMSSTSSPDTYSKQKLKREVNSDIERNSSLYSLGVELFDRLLKDKEKSYDLRMQINSLLPEIIGRLQQLKRFYALLDNGQPEQLDQSKYLPSLSLDQGAEFSNLQVVADLLNQKSLLETRELASPVFALLVKRLIHMGFKIHTNDNMNKIKISDGRIYLAEVIVSDTGEVSMVVY